jgi:regulator of protease activity HflC (stomatin/prohibitin superfamily)
MIIKKLLALTFAMAMLISTLGGCYLNSIVSADQMGIRLENGGIAEIVPAGRYSGGIWTSLERVDVSNKLVNWSDSVWTSDQQSIGIAITATVARPRDTEKLKDLYQNFNSVATNDEALSSVVLAKLPDAVKSIVPTMTLAQLAGIGGGETEKNRKVLTDSIFTTLSQTLDKLNIVLVDISIVSITVDESYSALLQEKANASLQVDVAEEQGRVKQAEAAAQAKVAEEQVKLLAQQLLQEQSQTEIDLEIARREQLVAAEMAKTYEQSPQAYKIALLNAYAEIFNDKTVYLPSDSQLFIDLEKMLSSEIASGTNSTSSVSQPQEGGAGQ